MASRKLAIASLPALLLIGALLLLVAASPGAVSEDDAASGQQFPSSLDRALEPSPKDSRAVRAGSPVASSLVGALPSAPAHKGSAAVPPQAPAPQPHPPCDSKDDEKKELMLFVLIILILCCLSNQ